MAVGRQRMAGLIRRAGLPDRDACQYRPGLRDVRLLAATSLKCGEDEPRATGGAGAVSAGSETTRFGAAPIGTGLASCADPKDKARMGPEAGSKSRKVVSMDMSNARSYERQPSADERHQLAPPGLTR